MELLTDPSIWIGLFTLIVLEIVLGIDNLVFIAILVKKLPPAQQDKARVIGLSLALVMRLLFLSLVSWLVTLTTPLLSFWGLSFSGRELILIAGGLFLLFKATSELHERLESTEQHEVKQMAYAGFGIVIAQILVLDAVFSLDSIITAVGMVDHLWVMMVAVIIAMIIMLLASKALTEFVNAHPTVVVLCLSFLLLIGFSLLAEVFSFHIPKGYLYAAIGFSIVIEFFNQVALRNKLLNEARRPLRARTADAIFKLMGGETRAIDHHTTEQSSVFVEEERHMITGVLSLAERSIKTVMTPRADIVWLNLNDSPEQQLKELLTTSHTRLLVCDGELDQFVGVVRAKDLMMALKDQQPIRDLIQENQAIMVPDTINLIRLLSEIRHARGQLIIANDEFGTIQGIVTPHDLLEAIVGEVLDEDETPEIIQENEAWLVKGSTDLHSLEQVLNYKGLVDPAEDYTSLAGMLLAWHGSWPEQGTVIEKEGLSFEIVKVEDFRIETVRIRLLSPSFET